MCGRYSGQQPLMIAQSRRKKQPQAVDVAGKKHIMLPLTVRT